MILKCRKCGTDISKEIDSAFENYQCGRLTCPKCSAKQNRYISETDLLIYFGLSIALYSLLIMLVYLMFNYIAIDFFTIAIVVGLLVVNYYVFKHIDRYIYDKAPLKSELKDHVIEEDIEAVSKRMRWQFMAFIVISLILVGQPGKEIGYLFLLAAFIAVVLIKIKLSLNNEKNNKGNR